MLLSMSLIAAELKKNVNMLHLPYAAEAKITSARLIDQNVQALDASYVYLCEPAQITSLLEHNIDLYKKNLIVYGNDYILSYPELENCNYIFLSGNVSFIFFINTLENIFFTYNEWEKKLTGMLSPAFTLQDMLDLGYAKIQIPMCALDPLYNVLAITPRKKSYDVLFQAMLDGYSYRSINIIQSSNPSLEEARKHDISEVINNVSHNRLRVATLKTDRQAVGYLALHKTDARHFSDSTLELFDFFLIFFRQKFAQLPTNPKLRSGLFDQFMTDMLHGKISDDKIIQQTLHVFHFHPDDSFQLYLFEIPEREFSSTRQLQDFMNTLEGLIPHSKCFYFESNVCLLTTDSDTETTLATLNGMIRTTGIRCAVSPKFNHIRYCQQAWTLTTEVFKHWPSGRHSIGNTDHAILNVIVSHIRNLLPQETLMHPHLMKLYQYDQKNGTEYLKTLICYLRNHCHIIHTANALYIHRNSVQYRIKKIEELLNIKIASCPERLDMLFSAFFLSDDLVFKEV